MAIQNGIVGGVSFKEAQVIAEGHPVVVRSRVVKANQGTLQPGQLLALDSAGLAVAYDPAYTPGQNDPPAPALYGVCLHLVDTAAEAAAEVIVHGTVVKAVLFTLAGAATPAVLEALEALTIYPV
ncbi:MAG: hypothetical protein LBJ14_05540 [Desulfarculales bacterium]|jgi:hypothetical protein|nr:hypothetical protein [Desulfarculales bacterium]